MKSLIFKCRRCEKETKQFVRIVTNNMPPYVHALWCSICSNPNIGFGEPIEEADN